MSDFTCSKAWDRDRARRERFGIPLMVGATIRLLATTLSAVRLTVARTRPLSPPQLNGHSERLGTVAIGAAGFSALSIWLIAAWNRA